LLIFINFPHILAAVRLFFSELLLCKWDSLMNNFFNQLALGVTVKTIPVPGFTEGLVRFCEKEEIPKDLKTSVQEQICPHLGHTAKLSVNYRQYMLALEAGKKIRDGYFLKALQEDGVPFKQLLWIELEATKWGEHLGLFVEKLEEKGAFRFILVQRETPKPGKTIFVEYEDKPHSGRFKKVFLPEGDYMYRVRGRPVTVSPTRSITVEKKEWKEFLRLAECYARQNTANPTESEDKVRDLLVTTGRLLPILFTVMTRCGWRAVAPAQPSSVEAKDNNKRKGKDKRRSKFSEPIVVKQLVLGDKEKDVGLALGDPDAVRGVLCLKTDIHLNDHLSLAQSIVLNPPEGYARELEILREAFPNVDHLFCGQKPVKAANKRMPGLDHATLVPIMAKLIKRGCRFPVFWIEIDQLLPNVAHRLFDDDPPLRLGALVRILPGKGFSVIYALEAADNQPKPLEPREVRLYEASVRTVYNVLWYERKFTLEGDPKDLSACRLEMSGQLFDIDSMVEQFGRQRVDHFVDNSIVYDELIGATLLKLMEEMNRAKAEKKADPLSGEFPDARVVEVYEEGHIPVRQLTDQLPRPIRLDLSGLTAEPGSTRYHRTNDILAEWERVKEITRRRVLMEDLPAVEARMSLVR
jgi:hypothetical protein